ncbi:MAG: efflux RND transporter periplasmic adaptor subunit [Patescibacteria group bacterium]|jgi:RND family efflux transporter MFP subunit|nr:efflux RND transporter periplasmic adaptor subunit [Patescibacteria group bacterium]
MKRKTFLLAFLLLPTLLLTACGSEEEVQESIVEPVSVSVQKVADSRELSQQVSYPAIVSADMEARLTAQLPGIIAEANFAVGQTVTAGQVLAQVNEIGANTTTSAQASSNQIKQALIAVQQAQESFELARSNYENTTISAARDLEQARIARDQAAKGLDNLGSTADESIKSAELAYEAAQLASEQAKLNLENRQKQLIQNENNLKDNADLNISSSLNAISSILSGVNNLTGFDKNNVINISYRSNLGALDSSSYSRAEDAYQLAQNSYKEYLSRESQNTEQDLRDLLAVVTKAQELSDALKYLFDKSIPSSNLPQNGGTGVSLASLQSSAAAFQTQANGVFSQVQNSLQAWQNFSLERSSALDSLNQAYNLAQKQEASAAQNLKSLQAGNTSQQDQASFSLALADNQYENLKVKLDSQIAATKTQMDSAQLQYQNALVNLQSLYDSRSIVAPIDATVFQKLVSNGDTVSAGQLVAVIGKSDGLKLKFFIEAENVPLLSVGQIIRAVDSDEREYQGKISSIAAQADSISKRFQVEATLDNMENPPLLGTVVNVKLSLNKDALLSNGSIFLPLSILEIGQNGSYVFLLRDGKAYKQEVMIESVIGETAKLKLEANDNDLIITSGNKFLSDGQVVNIKP